MNTTTPLIKITFGQYEGVGATKEDALRPVRQASYDHIMAHEMAHYREAGDLAIGGPHIDYDGNGIAVGGHVNIRMGGVDPANPEASLANAQRAYRAASAPGVDMSPQDQAVARRASEMMTQAQAMLARSPASNALPTKGNRLNIMG